MTLRKKPFSIQGITRCEQFIGWFVELYKYLNFQRPATQWFPIACWQNRYQLPLTKLIWDSQFGISQSQKAHAFRSADFVCNFWVYYRVPQKPVGRKWNVNPRLNILENRVFPDLEREFIEPLGSLHCADIARVRIHTKNVSIHSASGRKGGRHEKFHPETMCGIGDCIIPNKSEMLILQSSIRYLLNIFVVLGFFPRFWDRFEAGIFRQKPWSEEVNSRAIAVQSNHWRSHQTLCDEPKEARLL